MATIVRYQTFTVFESHVYWDFSWSPGVHFKNDLNMPKIAIKIHGDLIRKIICKGSEVVYSHAKSC